MRASTKKITLLGLLTAVALILGWFESMLPSLAVPGIKLGISNIVLLYAIYMMRPREAFVLMLLKVFLSGFLFGGVTAILYSLAGGLFSLTVMLLVKKCSSLSCVGVSVCGAVFHNIGQLLAAALVVESRAVFSYAPVLLVSAVVTGVLTGIAANLTLKALRSRNP